jgi:cytoskeletal protein CcmA (bactofilin family)
MSQNPASTRLVPADRLGAITSLIAEGAVFDGNFHTARDQGIKVDGHLKGNITFESGAPCMWGPAV